MRINPWFGAIVAVLLAIALIIYIVNHVSTH
jgi:YbbR domain-containing protein